ncbi:winged helix-turn-helix transcriptional regulator [Paracraurococcus lichenis]|uniref:winged helix-turn-helix transcriptional regulator n=1 Tax=Paracraurococcus lichenis TaxID=3064888 RepID=UPI00351D3051
MATRPLVGGTVPVQSRPIAAAKVVAAAVLGGRAGNRHDGRAGQVDEDEHPRFWSAVTDLARAAGFSPPAVRERVAQLEEAGVIRG